MTINLIFLIIRLLIRFSDPSLFVTDFAQLLVIKYLRCYQCLHFFFSNTCTYKIIYVAYCQYFCVLCADFSGF